MYKSVERNSTQRSRNHRLRNTKKTTYPLRKRIIQLKFNKTPSFGWKQKDRQKISYNPRVDQQNTHRLPLNSTHLASVRLLEYTQET